MKHESESRWRKSSHSDYHGGDCVEIAELSDKIGVRDSKNPSGHLHIFRRATFQTFMRAVRAEQHSR